MQKYKWLLILILISCTVSFFACDRGQQILETVLPDPEPVTPPEMVTPEPPEMVDVAPQIDVSDLQNRLTVEGATAVSAQLPETSTAQTAPRIQADVGEINTSPGGTVSLPFVYSGANNLSGCIVCIEGVDGYFDLPYIGAPDDLPSAISVGLPQNAELGSFIVCYSVYDDQGQIGNFLNIVINVVEPEPPEVVEMPMIAAVDVLIYTNRSYWITLEDVAIAAETTRNLVESEGFSAEITKDSAHVREWMLQTTGDGNVNVVIFYGVLPDSVYGNGNSQPDGSIAENWIETTDGDTILNIADYIAYNSDLEVGEVTGALRTKTVGLNREGGLQNLMDNPNISLRDNRIVERKTMIVTSDGMALSSSLVDFESYRSVQLNQLQGEWFAEKIFASDTGNDQAACADPVIIRDGNRGRLAIVHGTPHGPGYVQGLSNGEVAAEIIINYLLSE